MTRSGSTLLVGRSRLATRDDGQDFLSTYVDMELWDIDDAGVTRLAVAPDGVTVHGSAISPDGAHVTSAWVTESGVLEVGIATVADLVVADLMTVGDQTWDPELWSVTTLADDPIDNLGPSARDRRPVCWCDDQIVVIAGETVHVIEPTST